MSPNAESHTEAKSAPAEQATRGAVHLFDLAGIKITIDYTWLIVFALVLWSLSAGYFPIYYGGYTSNLYWIAGVIATILFFASILIHELSHSLMAIRHGIKIPEITLFIFGGISKLSRDPTDPKSELKIAIAGPLSSLVLAVIFAIVKVPFHTEPAGLLYGIFDYLAWINVALAVFNLIPGYPLDGGRILRAIVWWKTGSVERATKWASDIGQGFAWALMALGAIQVFLGSLIGGLWLLFIGLFLRGIAMGGYQEVLMKQSLEGVRVNEVMIDDVIVVPPHLHLDELSHEYFLRHGHGGFPVMRDGKPLGLISLSQVTSVPHEERHRTAVEQVMVPLSEGIEIEPNQSLAEALRKMRTTGHRRLLVMDGDNLRGMITMAGLLRFLEIKRVLEA